MDPCGILPFFNFSKHKLNIYKTKHIEIILILMGVEQILKKNQPELNSLTSINSAYAYDLQEPSIEILKPPEFLIFRSYQDM